jgi:hypothetical protein
MGRRNSKENMRRKGCLVGLLGLALSGCGEDPFRIRWTENPTEQVLYALDREELNQFSGFDMIGRLRVVIEDPQTEGAWDFAVDREGGAMVFLPPRTLGLDSRAGIAPIPGSEYDDVTVAPADTLAYVVDEPVPIALGTVYVIRTRLASGGFGRVCHFFGKLEPLEIDAVAGVVRLVQDTSPDCNNRSLIPPDD